MARLARGWLPWFAIWHDDYMAKQGDPGGSASTLTQPPEGWRWGVTIGWPVAGELAGGATTLVSVGTQLLPSRFVLFVRPPEPADAWIRLMCEVVDGAVTVPIMVAEGMDTPRAADLLRKAMPMKSWIDNALDYLVFQLLLEQVRKIGDVSTLSKVLHVPDDEAAAALKRLSQLSTGALLNASESDAAALQADPRWASALDAVRSQYDGGALGRALPAKTPVRGTPRRNSVTKEHLQDVAAEYRKADAQGLPPTKTVANQFGASHSTAARWVGMARQQGFLGAASPGRSGEDTVDQ